MRRSLIAALAILVTFTAAADVWQAEYGVARTFDFVLFNADGTLDVDEVDGGTEVTLDCDGTATNPITNDFVDEGSFYSIALTAAEMQCERITVTVAATLTSVFHIETFGHASAFNETLGWLTGDPFPNTATLVSKARDVEVTTIDTLASQTSFTLIAGSADDNAYNGYGIKIIDASTATQSALGVIQDYTGATKTVTLCGDPAVFTMAATDNVVLLPAKLDCGEASASIAKLDDTLELDGAVYRFTANSLETAPSGGLDAAGVRAALGYAAATHDDDIAELLAEILASRTQLLIATADSGTTTTMVDTEATFANAESVIGRYLVRDDLQACFVNDFDPMTDTYDFGACTFTGAWSTQPYKLYPAGTQ